jgi:hypothetical protein
MISLTRKHPRERVDWACGVALEKRLFRHKQLVVRRLTEFASEDEQRRWEWACDDRYRD